MKIIIIGDGKVGETLAELLSIENHDVTIIDKNADRLKKTAERLDVMCIKGNGLSARVMLEAGVRESDLLIAATSSDEMNMVCCLTAKNLGVKHTIARIRDTDYASELSMLQAELGLNMVINPEQAAAREIARMIKFPPAINVELFAKGRVEMVELEVRSDMPIAGKSLIDVAKKVSPSVLIGAVRRGEDVFIPNGDFVIQEADNIYIVGQPSKVYNFCSRIGIHVQKIKHVMIMGGGRVGYYLTQYLNEMNIRVKIIEIDYNRCVELTELLPKALIVWGDGSDETLLQSENLEEMGAFVAITDKDEENLITALVAKQNGVKKVVAKINKVNYDSVVNSLDIDNIVSPKMITANYILQYVRAMQNTLGNPVNALYRIVGDKAEAMEFTAGVSPLYNNIPLKDMKIMRGILLAAIVRKNEIIIPHGKDVILPGDSVILISKDKTIIDLNDIIEAGAR